MRQKEVNEIRDRAINGSNRYLISNIIAEYGMPSRRYGNQIYTWCPHCNHMPKSKRMDYFSFTESVNLYHCFFCGEGGGPAKFLSTVAGIPYIDAALILGERSGAITSEEARKALSNRDNYAKFAKGTESLKQYEMLKGEIVEHRAPVETVDLVYRHMLNLSEFKLSDSGRVYLAEKRHYSDNEIVRNGFFTYNEPFSIDRLFQSIVAEKPDFTYDNFVGVPGFYFEYADNNKTCGRWKFVNPSPECLGIPLINSYGQIIALQMRNLSAYAKSRYFYVSSKKMCEGKSGFGSSPGSPVAVCYPEKILYPHIYIGEGYFKMKELAKEGMVGLSIQGVNSTNFIPYELENLFASGYFPFDKKDAKFVIAFDADMFEKMPVLNAALGLTKLLNKQYPQIPVYFLIWEARYGKGIDDVKFNLAKRGESYKSFVKAIDANTIITLTKETTEKAICEVERKSGKKIERRNLLSDEGFTMEVLTGLKNKIMVVLSS